MKQYFMEKVNICIYSNEFNPFTVHNINVEIVGFSFYWKYLIKKGSCNMNFVGFGLNVLVFAVSS